MNIHVVCNVEVWERGRDSLGGGGQSLHAPKSDPVGCGRLVWEILIYPLFIRKWLVLAQVSDLFKMQITISQQVLQEKEDQPYHKIGPHCSVNGEFKSPSNMW